MIVGPAIQLLLDGHHLVARGRPRADGLDHGRARRRAPRSPASSSRCARRARPRTRSPASRRRCASTCAGHAGPHARRRHRRHGRRRRAHVQHLDGCRARRRGRRCGRGEARQPRGELGGRARPTCSRRSGSRSSSRRSGSRSRSTSSGSASCSPGPTTRRCGTSRRCARSSASAPSSTCSGRWPTRPAHATGSSASTPPTLVRPTPRRSPSSAPGAPSSCTATVASTSSRRTGPNLVGRGRRRRRPRVGARPARARRSSPATRPSCGAAPRPRTPPSSALCSPARPGGRRDAVLLNAAGALVAAGLADDLARRARRSAPTRSTPAPRRAGSMRSSAFSGGAGLMGRFDDALAAAGLGAIAEIKRRSPSAGDLRPDADPAADRARLRGAQGRPRSRCSSTSASAAPGTISAPPATATRLPLLAKGFFSTEEQLRTASEAGRRRSACCSCAISTTPRRRGADAYAAEPRARHARRGARRRGARPRGSRSARPCSASTPAISPPSRSTAGRSSSSSRAIPPTGS